MYRRDAINRVSTKIFDIGSGGGFPGIPLAIMRPNWDFTLCESITKKANFLMHLVKELVLQEKVIVINKRVETLHATSLQFNEQFDLVTARAIAKLDILIKYALPLLKKDGLLISYKAREVDDEIMSAKKIIEKNKLKLKIFSKEINNVERKLVVIGC